MQRITRVKGDKRKMFEKIRNFWNSLFEQNIPTPVEPAPVAKPKAKAKTTKIVVNSSPLCGVKGCGKSFASLRGLQIHTGRAHKA